MAVFCLPTDTTTDGCVVVFSHQNCPIPYTKFISDSHKCQRNTISVLSVYIAMYIRFNK